MNYRTTRIETCRWRGMVAAQVALIMTVLIGMAAIVLDGGLLLAERRHAQAAADAAALAAAADLFAKFRTDGGLDASGSAALAAQQYVTNNYEAAFRENLEAPAIVNVGTGLSAQSLPVHRNPGFVEVIVQYNQPRLFSQMFGSDSIPIRARAVAQGTWLPTMKAIVALGSGGTALQAGNGEIVVNGPGGVASNSGAATGPNGSITAGGTIDVSGSASGTFSPAANTGASPQPDPFSYLPAPVPPPPGIQTNVAGNVYLTPGSYSNLSFSGGTKVFLHEASAGNGGIYYLTGGLSTAGNAGIQLARFDGTSNFSSETGGIMIYVASGSLDLSGNGDVNISGLTSGPYSGFLIFQARTNTSGMTIQGNGVLTALTGLIYAPSASVTIGGNGGVTISGSGIVSNSIDLNGDNASLTVNFNTEGAAKTRVVTLVE